MLKRSLGKLASEFPGVAYISGAGSGIGAATAQAFVRAGCSRVFLTDLNPSTLERTTKSLRDLSPDVRVETAAGDISSRHFIDEIFDKLHSDFGRLDYAVNCAGMIGSGKSTSESSVEEFDKVTDVNYRGVWMCSRRQLQMMKEQPLLEQGQEDQRRRQRGSIVNIASQLGIVGRPKSSAYCATKSAIIGLTRCDAIDHSENLIRINAVCPGFIDTPLVHPLTEESKKYIAISPMNRVGTPEEVADVVVFLSGEKASFVQGAAWTVDGGYTIN